MKERRQEDLVGERGRGRSEMSVALGSSFCLAAGNEAVFVLISPAQFITVRGATDRLTFGTFSIDDPEGYFPPYSTACHVRP